MLRLALSRSDSSLLQWFRLQNIWGRLGRPLLKPSPVTKRLLLLTDATSEGLRPALELFSAAFGVGLQATTAPFDSVEQTVLGLSRASDQDCDAAVLLLSEEWLRRQLGASSLVECARVDDAKNRLADLVSTLREKTSRYILVGNFPGSTYHMPAGAAVARGYVGWNIAVSQLNLALAALSLPQTYVVDVADAVFGAGGRTALGRSSFFRARIAYETAGTLAVARALALALAGIFGKRHRAIVTDLDNTLWGGEIGELGPDQIVLGPETPDGLAFGRVQEYLKGLTRMGVLVAAVSRNDSNVVELLRDRSRFTLAADDFASIHASWIQKSRAIDHVAADLGFGPEFMVFLDDSLFEIAEVLRTHPHIDVLLAGPDPQLTLERLSQSAFFNTVALVHEDIERNMRAGLLRQQREQSRQFENPEDFLRAIQIRVYASLLDDTNGERVVQLLQKSNQFNLTTRRHNRRDLQELCSRGATIWAFGYEDTFGSQGIISVVVTLPHEDHVQIESWVMSCRVLNRTVELAVFDHIRKHAGGKRLVGEYIPTERNGIVKRLYADLGFELQARCDYREIWVWQEIPEKSTPPCFADLVTR